MVVSLTSSRRNGVPVAVLPALFSLALASSILAGCTAVDGAAPEPEIPAPVDLCALAAPAGPTSDAVVVEGEVGSPAAVAFAGPLAVTGTERSVVVEGAGEPVGGADLVGYALTVIDAATGEEVQSQGYDGAPMLPVPAVSIGQSIGCVPVGSRVVVTVPETDVEPASVRVYDVLSALPTMATGEVQEPVAGMPTVDVAESGAPTVTIPAAEPPAETTVAVLKMGPGAVVAPGDSVMVHYAGVRWSNGEIFDSSWSKGTPTVLVTSDAIAGYREALEGHTVGSQVLVAIPPESAYGEGEINEDDLTGETLVFVVDLLATAPTPR